MRETEHAIINVLTPGDLSSLRFIENPLRTIHPEDYPTKELCSVYYSALNFRDIMLATGKLPPDAIPGKRILLTVYISFKIYCRLIEKNV